MQKSSCYIPIVRPATLWKRNISHANPSPPHERAALPCSRFTDHMKNFSESLKLRSLCFLHFPVSPGKIQTPVACESLLCAHPHTIPRSPVVSVASSEEESHGESSSSRSPCNECDGTLVIPTVRREIRRARGAPSEAWSSPILAKHVTKKPVRSQSVIPLHLEAAGTHISRHARLQNPPSRNSRGDSAPLGPAARPYTAIGLCRRSQTPLASSGVPRSSSEPEPEMEDRKAAPASPRPGVKAHLH
ncbi:uncharacterized protein C12orf42 homolog [Ailuropoda melanoleuca]|uniref:uncharacterized protein C12orf42 homolog n=1 Tax=Ailuropoda melanoleuca TaxID=9646 RepID=UPI0014940A6A|nr:uncharacterized protein C12orf42 homolog [Ailuropoda melanoleuca]